MEEKEYSNVYAIPANYTDSGKLLGGMVETRNAVEAVLLVALVGYPELMWIPMSTTIRIVVMTVTLIPLGVLAVMGIDGDSLVQYMIDMLKSMDMYLSECQFQQEEALRSVMPFLQISPKLLKKTQRNVLTSGAASTYMFTSFEMSDDSGVLLGVNRHNNSLCIVDLFNTKINKNANLTMCGTSGAGKTFTLQLLALRMRMRGIQCYIIAPIKGHEFKRACSKIGGEFIKIAPGSPHCINVMEIRHTISPEMELIDEVDYNDMDSMLARKIQQLMIFFSLLIPDMTNEEEQMLDDHDNIELNMVTDTVAVRVMADDSPMLCRHYYCSAVGDKERTEVYVIPRSDFFKWLEMEDHIPESGLKVEKTPSIFG